MKDCCIVIPIYKETLDCVEEISLKRLRKILVDDEIDRCYHERYEFAQFYDIYLVCPKEIGRASCRERV